MRRIRTVLLGLATLAAGLEVQAQCAIVPGTGCGLPPLKTCVNNPKIGTLFCMSALPCPAGCGTLQFNAWFFGPPAPIAIPLLGCCTTAPCVLYSPSIHHVQFRPPGLECYPIPADPTLIGVMLALQPACFDPATSCISLAPALLISIR
jgi:hypothetical protein